MPDLFMTKVKTARSYALMPAHQQDEDALKKLPVGQPLRVKVTRMRNVQFHRLYFALLNYAFDCWEPKATVPNVLGLEVEKNFDRFRHDVTILCGFYESYYRLNGEVRIEPRSISFSSMGQDEFEELYAKTIDVIIKYVLTGFSGDQLREIIEQIEEFE